MSYIRIDPQQGAGVGAVLADAGARCMGILDRLSALASAPGLGRWSATVDAQVGYARSVLEQAVDGWLTQGVDMVRRLRDLVADQAASSVVGSPSSAGSARSLIGPAIVGGLMGGPAFARSPAPVPAVPDGVPLPAAGFVGGGAPLTATGYIGGGPPLSATSSVGGGSPLSAAAYVGGGSPLTAAAYVGGGSPLTAAAYVGGGSPLTAAGYVGGPRVSDPFGILGLAQSVQVRADRSLGYVAGRMAGLIPGAGPGHPAFTEQGLELLRAQQKLAGLPLLPTVP